MRSTMVTSLILTALAVVAVPVPAAAQSARDRTIVPGERVGAITARSSLAALRRIYGARNVKAVRVPVGEGHTVPGIAVFPGTRAEVQLRLSEDGKRITLAQIGRPKSPWRTRGGIRIGTGAARVARLNGRPFRLHGFGWDYAGRTAGWNGGRLPAALTLDFRPTRKIPQRAYQQVLGDAAHPSSHPVMERLRLVVGAILVELK